MVEKSYFEKLNLKRKIYKAALSVREAEKISGKGRLDLSDCLLYKQYLSETSHPKAEKAASVLSAAISEAEKAENPTKAVMVLNFCFHNLMELIGEQVNEQSFTAGLPEIKIFDKTAPLARFETAAIIDNLRSPFNVGSIFRSADAFGTGELALCGITPHPPMLKLERTAMGTTESVPWKYFNETAEAINYFRKKGYKITGIETAEGAGKLPEIIFRIKTALVFGNEEFGLTDEAISLCDEFVEIPQVGMKNSINVASAFSVVMYDAMKALITTSGK